MEVIYRINTFNIYVKAYMYVQALKSLFTVANKAVIKTFVVAASCWDVLGLDR